MSTPAASIIRAGCMCCPTATCWSPRATRRPSPRRSSASGNGPWGSSCDRPAPRSRAPTASRCCATPTATASPRCARPSSSELNSPFGMALLGDTLYVANTDAIVAFPYQEGATEITAAGEKIVDLPGGPINHHWTKDVIASPDGTQALRDRRLEQQRRRERHGGRGEPRRRARDRSRHAIDAAVRLGAAKPERPVLAARQRCALGRGQRARRDRQRPGARLHDLGAGRRLLRLALQLLRPACRRAGRAAASRSRRQGHRAGLRARSAHRLARPDVQHHATASAPSAATAPSSASTARGTGCRAAATR